MLLKVPLAVAVVHVRNYSEFETINILHEPYLMTSFNYEPIKLKNYWQQFQILITTLFYIILFSCFFYSRNFKLASIIAAIDYFTTRKSQHQQKQFIWYPTNSMQVTAMKNTELNRQKQQMNALIRAKIVWSKGHSFSDIQTMAFYTVGKYYGFPIVR